MRKKRNIIRIFAISFLSISLTVFVFLIIMKDNNIRYDTTISQNEGLEGNKEKESVVNEYYDSLRAKCYQENNECCLSSVDYMKERGLELLIGNVCPKGYKKNSLKCEGSLVWCEKNDELGYYSDFYLNGKILNVQDLIDKKIEPGTKVRVRGNLGKCIMLKVHADYEGLPSGCRLVDVSGKGVVVLSRSQTNKSEGDEIVIEGIIGDYCGGDKLDKYLCYIKNVKLLNVKLDEY